jgi:hypothetical protein
MATAGSGDVYVRQLTAALAVASICILTAGCSSGSNQGIETSTTRSTTTTTTAPPLADTALHGLLLSPEQVNTAMGTTEMTVTKTHFAMSDDSATMEPKECLAIDGSAQAQVYAGSGYTAERDQTLQEGFARCAQAGRLAINDRMRARPAIPGRPRRVVRRGRR